MLFNKMRSNTKENIIVLNQSYNNNNNNIYLKSNIQKSSIDYVVLYMWGLVFF